MVEQQMTAAELGSKHGVNKSYGSRVVRLNFIAPDITEAIFAGSQPAALDAKMLLGLHDLPLSWSDQKQKLQMFPAV